MKKPKWILDRTVEAIHKRQIAEHGGVPGLKDANNLQAALARPKNLLAYENRGLHPTDLAAAYAFGIAKINHPFNDGNKRTAMVVALTFLKINGMELTVNLQDRYDKFEGIAAGRISERDLATWLKLHTRPVTPDRAPRLTATRKSRTP